jgi:hypothetical protein
MFRYWYLANRDVGKGTRIRDGYLQVENSYAKYAGLQRRTGIGTQIYRRGVHAWALDCLAIELHSLGPTFSIGDDKTAIAFCWLSNGRSRVSMAHTTIVIPAVTCSFEDDRQSILHARSRAVNLCLRVGESLMIYILYIFSL